MVKNENATLCFALWSVRYRTVVDS